MFGPISMYVASFVELEKTGFQDFICLEPINFVKNVLNYRMLAAQDL